MSRPARASPPGSTGKRGDKLQFTSVISFLQEEWRAHEAAKNQWGRERKILIHKVAELEAEAVSAKNLVEMLERRTMMLEEALRRERELHWGQPQPNTWADEEITQAIQRATGSYLSQSSQRGVGAGSQDRGVIQAVPKRVVHKGRKGRSPSPSRRGEAGQQRGRANGDEFQPSGRSLSPPLPTELASPWEDMEDMDDAMQEAAVMAAVNEVLHHRAMAGEEDYDEDDEDEEGGEDPFLPPAGGGGASSNGGLHGNGHAGRRSSGEASPPGGRGGGESEAVASKGEFKGFAVALAEGDGAPATPSLPGEASGMPVWSDRVGPPRPIENGGEGAAGGHPPSAPGNNDSFDSTEGGEGTLPHEAAAPPSIVHEVESVWPGTEERKIPDGMLHQSLRSHLDGVQAVAFDAGGLGTPRLLSASEDGTLKLWQLQPMESSKEDQEPLATFRGHTGGVYACALNLATSRAFSGGEDGAIRSWVLPAPGDGLYSRHGHAAPYAAPSLAGHSDVVWQIALEPGGSGRLASASADCTVKLWDTTREGEGEEPLLTTLRVPESPFPPALSRFADAVPGSPSAANEGGKEDAFESAMGGDSQPGTSSGHEKGAASRPTCVAFASEPAGGVGQLLVGCTDGALYRFDVESGEYTLLSQPDPHSMEPRPPLVNQIAMHPSMPVVHAASDDGLVRSYDVRARAEPVDMFLVCAEGVTAVAIDPAGVQLATAGFSGWVKLWDIRQSRTCLVELPAHSPKMGEGCHALAYAPLAGTVGGVPLLASGGADGAVCLWSR